MQACIFLGKHCLWKPHLNGVKIPQCNYIYYIMEDTVQVRVQYVIVTGIVMLTIKQTNEFPKKVGNKKIKQSYTDKGTFTIEKSDLEEIHQEIRRRDTLGYVEEEEEEEESDQKSDDNDGNESKLFV